MTDPAAGPDPEAIAADYARLVFPQFDERVALALGQDLVSRGLAAGLPIVVDIRTSDRVLFHAALPGAAPLNDRWVARKSATALLFQLPSLLVGLRNREKAETLARHGLSSETHADNGGAVPIQVDGTGVVACVTVSGLPQVEDHRLAVAGIKAVLATL
ncbi:heme-binding protein [Rhodobacter sp. Har01]|uniref:heme-degrading domain-containing protein n=1 Tax=Rhodobacter sp. Har01 TaxID=2883999 RepID=UPI001D07CAB8|nr:heme-binding protein [Rhodobacter sp. Har01]MCB6177569.1 heme-binding protein [Rhodobacter sp. Har01]